VINCLKKFSSLIALLFLFFSCEQGPEISTAITGQKEIKTEKRNFSEIKEENEGKAIFKKLNCNACHMKKANVIGPSLKKIRNNYLDQEEALLNFLNGSAKPKIDPEEYPKMQPSIEAFKKLSKEDQQKLIDYLLEE
tara:strand:+ start:78447 stop:78857 length:411 start_codon:yes stop_codon:yes gene_type:complete